MQGPVFDDVADPACVCRACEAERRREALARRTGGGPVRRVRRTAATVVTAGCVAAGLASQLTSGAEEEAAVDDGRSRSGPGDLVAGTTGLTGATGLTEASTQATTTQATTAHLAAFSTDPAAQARDPSGPGATATTGTATAAADSDAVGTGTGSDGDGGGGGDIGTDAGAGTNARGTTGRSPGARPIPVTAGDAARTTITGPADITTAPLAPGTRAGIGGFTTPQGMPGPLRDPAATSAGQALTPALTRARPAPLTRSQIIARAATWLGPKIPYSQTNYHNGYRTDCSGYVSMAWNIGTNAWTGNLADFAVPIAKGDLAAGDILLFHNAANPVSGSHVVIFDKWADSARTRYYGYELTPPNTMYRSIPYGYFSNASSYKPYRYKYLAEGAGDPLLNFPGAEYFGPGKVNDYVTRLGEMLVARGGGRFYTEGPSPDWGEADRQATGAFQQAQGWTGSEADGIPGIHTWDLLVTETGKDIPPAPVEPAPVEPVPATPPLSGPVPFPGTQYFGPGKVNEHITRLGQALVAKGYGRHYTEGPGPEWSEADRRNTQDFQRAQGWTGAEADGYPGPHTWRLLMS